MLAVVWLIGHEELIAWKVENMPEYISELVVETFVPALEQNQPAPLPHPSPELADPTE